jgi:amino acid transporter
VAVSSVFGWLMLAAVVLAMPNLDQAAAQGNNVFYWTLKQALPKPLVLFLLIGISITQYCCALAGMTSASRMMYAFARDGGLPASSWLRHVSRSGSPAPAVWTISFLAIFVMVFVPYSAIAASCAVFLYISYVLPTAAGFWAHGRSWTKMGPWHLGRWYRPLAIVAMVGCLGLIVIGIQPPNQIAVKILGGTVALMIVVWFALERKRFQGPPSIDVS